MIKRFLKVERMCSFRLLYRPGTWTFFQIPTRNSEICPGSVPELGHFSWFRPDQNPDLLTPLVNGLVRPVRVRVGTRAFLTNSAFKEQLVAIEGNMGGGGDPLPLYSLTTNRQRAPSSLIIIYRGIYRGKV